MKALIIGAGPGGLGAALALRKIGWEVEVFEKEPSPTAGAGLTLWSNGIRALRELGVDRPLIAAGTALEETPQKTSSGEDLQRLELGAIGRKVGCPSVVVSREELIKVLRVALPSGVVTYGRALDRLEIDAQGITARFTQGPMVRGDILVGADGLHSRVRELLWGPGKARYSGYTSWRAMVPREVPGLGPQNGLLMLGAGAQAGMMPCGPGRTYLFFTRNQALNQPRPADWRSFFQTWSGPLPSLLESVDPQAALGLDIYDRPPVSRWGKGRVTLLGDAIHPSTPKPGQGACQALESACWLAHYLRWSGPRVEEGLRAYEAHRRPRTARVTRASWYGGKMLQWQHPWLVRLRNFLLARSLMQRVTRMQMESLLSWTVPAL